MLFVALGLHLASWITSPQPFAVQLPAAPTRRSSGRILDAISRAPIAGATVMLVPWMQLPSPSTRGTITDAHGNFIFRRLELGPPTVQCRIVMPCPSANFATTDVTAAAVSASSD